MASHTNRTRATRAQMEARHNALIDLAAEHAPATSRQLYYRSVVAGIVDKTESGYTKVQRALVDLRRQGRIPFDHIVDTARTVRRTTTFSSVDDALARTAAFYRRDLWSGHHERVEIWCESESIATSIAPVCSKWAVDLYPTRGFSSVSFTWNAAQIANDDGRPLRILYCGDHDPAGLELEAAAQRDLTEHATVPIKWERLAVTWSQATEWSLPGTPPKKDYGFPLAVEAEAIPPQQLRDIVDHAIDRLADHDRLDVLLQAEQSERQILRSIRGAA